MMRVSLVIWLIVVTAVAVGLYHVKYEVKRLEAELDRVNREIREEREALHVLEAEWSYLNRPRRLARLAEKHLDMRPLQPEQIVRVAQLPPRITRPERDGPAAAASSDGVPLPGVRPWSLTPEPHRSESASEASPFLAAPFLAEASR